MAGVDGVRRLPLWERPERSHHTESFNNQPTDSAEEPKLKAVVTYFAKDKIGFSYKGKIPVGKTERIFQGTIFLRDGTLVINGVSMIATFFGHQGKRKVVP